MTLPEAIPQQTFRIIDANLNRIGEGLRFLEDLARLMLNDEALTGQLKTMRHEILEGEWALHRQLLQSRDAEGDVGIDLKAPEETKRELPLAAVANARRVQESLRVLEELSKVPRIFPNANPEKYKKARFTIYTIERELLSKLSRQDKTKRISGLYAIIDTQALKGRSHTETAKKAINGGARVIQLRDKHMSKKELLPVARELRDLCAEREVLFIVNDYIDVAMAVDADGVHLGQKDLPVAIARKMLPVDKILGSSTTSVEVAEAAQSDGADYIAVGSIYPTESKDEVTVVGLETLRKIRHAVAAPLVAIGGINRDNAGEVIAAGANSVAVINAVLGTEDIEKAAHQIAVQFETR